MFGNCLIITFFQCLQKILLTHQQIVTFVSSNIEKVVIRGLCIFAISFWEVHVFLDPSSLRKRNFAFI